MTQAVADKGVESRDALVVRGASRVQEMPGEWRASDWEFITSVVCGGDAGVIAYGLSHSLAAAIGVGSATGALLLGWATWYQWGRWCHASPPPPEPTH